MKRKNAKQRPSRIPQVPTGEETEMLKEPAPPPPLPPALPKGPEVREITLSIPMTDVDDCKYAAENVQLNMIGSPVQRKALQSLFAALHNGGYRLANGRHVDQLPDALRWLFEQMAARQAKLP